MADFRLIDIKQGKSHQNERTTGFGLNMTPRPGLACLVLDKIETKPKKMPNGAYLAHVQFKGSIQAQIILEYYRERHTFLPILFQRMIWIKSSNNLLTLKIIHFSQHFLCEVIEKMCIHLNFLIQILSITSRLKSLISKLNLKKSIFYKC